MSSTTFNEEKNCPAYFKYEGKAYQCVGNDDNQFWAIIDGESKGFEQSNCIVLQVKKDFNVTHLSFGLPILVNGELCTVDHIKPFDFSSTVKDGFVIVFDSENGILETEESDIIKIFEATPSKELKSAEEMYSKIRSFIGDCLFEKNPSTTNIVDGLKFIIEEHRAASQLHPSPTPDVTEAVDFAEWVMKNTKQSLDENYVIYNRENFWTIPQLYSLFKNQKQ